MSKKVYTMRELVRAKAKAEKIQREIWKLQERFEDVLIVSIPLNNAAIVMGNAINAILALPGGVRP